MLLETINCPFCSSDKYATQTKHMDWCIVKCSNCGFNYTNPRPKVDDLYKYYEEDYYMDERHVSKFYNNDGTEKSNSSTYLNRILEIENLVAQRGVLLEIGSAWGEFLNSMKNRGWKTIGVEISADGVKKAKRLYEIDCFNGDYLDYRPEELVDIICMYQTFEHLPNPKEVLHKCYKSLKAEGLILIEVPHFKSFDLFFNKKRKILSYDLPRHLNHFTPKTLKKQLEAEGFKIVSINNYYPFFVNYILTKWKKVKKETIRNEKVSFIKQGTIPLMKIRESKQSRILKGIARIVPGWRFTIIAQK